MNRIIHTYSLPGSKEERKSKINLATDKLNDARFIEFPN